MNAVCHVAAIALAALLWPVSLRADTRISEAVRKAADYHRQGLYREAEKAAAEALSLVENSRSSPDFDAAAGLNDLAALAYAQGELVRAEQLFERSRAAYEKLAGPDDTRLATVLYNLAGVCVELGKYPQAESFYRRSLGIREKALGAAHPHVAEIWNDLGFLDLQQRKYKEAEGRLGKALEIWEHSGVADAAYAAVALNNLALLRRLQGDSRAESLYKQAVDTEEKFFGWDHPEVAATLANLAALHRAQGRSGEAAEKYRQALAILEKKLGAQDPLAVEVRQQLTELTGEAVQILIVRTKNEAEELRRRIEAGEKFADLAARHSIDPSSSNGGIFRARASELREELRVEIDRLKAGQVSAVFPLAGNWAILKKISEPAAAK